MFAPQTVYDPKCLIAIFDLRCPGAEERLQRELSAWLGRAHAERLLDGHVVLVMHPGGVRGGGR